MKFNFHGRHHNLEHRGEKSALQKLLQSARDFDLEEFLEKLRGGENTFLVPEYIDQKTKPEGSKGLTVIERTNVHGAPVVDFSDGSGYIDYDKLEGNSEINAAMKTLFDKGLRSGNFKIKTLYKPDGATFRTVDVAPRSGPVAAPANNGKLGLSV